MITHATPAEACTGSALGLLFRQARDAMWARMERELAAAGHELNFSQFITLKRLSAGRAAPAPWKIGTRWSAYSRRWTPENRRSSGSASMTR